MEHISPFPSPPAFPFSVVGFDLDGTLVDSSEDLRAALNHALALAGRAQVGPEMARRMIGGGTRAMLSRALEHTGGAVAAQDMPRLSAALVKHYAANIAHHTRLFPGGAHMLDDLARRGVALAVVTNKLEHLAVRLLGEMGLSQRFYTIIGGDTLGPGRAKPAPDLLHEMAARSGMAAPRCAFVGDTSFDINAAKAAGMPSVAVSFGFNDVPAAALGADAVIEHFDVLVPALLAV